MTSHPWFWPFNFVVLILLALDLFVFHRKAHAVSFREAAGWSIFWVTLSLLFNWALWHEVGHEKGLEFFTGYLIEKALSVDNIFVFVLIFRYFQVGPEHQHRVLFWGVLGALVMRGVMIALGVEIVTKFHWTLYIFGLFLVITGLKMLFSSDEVVDLEKNWAIRLCRRWFRVTPEYHGSRFFVVQNGVWMLTPLALVLVVIDVMDLIFAVDSIPAIFAVTQDPFIIYSSNICAILGLRAMYFLLAQMVDTFEYLKYGLAAVLTFIGAKMLLSGVFHVSILASLLIVGGCLVISVAASFILPRQKEPAGKETE